MFQFFGLFSDDNFAHNREAESACEEVTKISDENKKNFEKVIAVIGERLEGVPLAITVYFSKKGIKVGWIFPPCFSLMYSHQLFFQFSVKAQSGKNS